MLPPAHPSYIAETEIVALPDGSVSLHYYAIDQWCYRVTSVDTPSGRVYRFTTTSHDSLDHVAAELPIGTDLLDVIARGFPAA